MKRFLILFLALTTAGAAWAADLAIDSLEQAFSRQTNSALAQVEGPRWELAAVFFRSRRGRGGSAVPMP